MAIPTAMLAMGVGATRLDVSRYSLNANHILANVTTSGNSGGTIHAPVVRDPSWQADLPLDEAVVIETVLGGGTGTVIADLRFLTGATRYDKLVNTTIQSITKTSDPSADVGRISVSGIGGVLTINN